MSNESRLRIMRIGTKEALQLMAVGRIDDARAKIADINTLLDREIDEAVTAAKVAPARRAS